MRKDRAAGRILIKHTAGLGGGSGRTCVAGVVQRRGALATGKNKSLIYEAMYFGL